MDTGAIQLTCQSLGFWAVGIFTVFTAFVTLGNWYMGREFARNKELREMEKRFWDRIQESERAREVLIDKADLESLIVPLRQDIGRTHEAIDRNREESAKLSREVAGLNNGLQHVKSDVQRMNDILIQKGFDRA